MNYNNILVSKLMFRPPLVGGCSETPRLPTYPPIHPKILSPGPVYPDGRIHKIQDYFRASIAWTSTTSKTFAYHKGRGQAQIVEKRITTWCVSNAKAIGAMR